MPGIAKRRRTDSLDASARKVGNTFQKVVALLNDPNMDADAQLTTRKSLAMGLPGALQQLDASGARMAWQEGLLNDVRAILVDHVGKCQARVTATKEEGEHGASFLEENAVKVTQTEAEIELAAKEVEAQTVVLHERQAAVRTAEQMLTAARHRQRTVGKDRIAVEKERARHEGEEANLKSLEDCTWESEKELRNGMKMLEKYLERQQAELCLIRTAPKALLVLPEDRQEFDIDTVEELNLVMNEAKAKMDEVLSVDEETAHRKCEEEINAREGDLEKATSATSAQETVLEQSQRQLLVCQEAKQAAEDEGDARRDAIRQQDAKIEEVEQRLAVANQNVEDFDFLVHPQGKGEQSAATEEPADGGEAKD